MGSASAGITLQLVPVCRLIGHHGGTASSTHNAYRCFYLVRTARLELAHLSALPPQDSVSTNFTTSAVFSCLNCMRKPCSLSFPDSLRFYPESLRAPVKDRAKSRYFVGICPAPEAAAAGATGTGTVDGAGAVVPGICAAPDAAGAGAVMPMPSSTLLPVRGCALPK